MKVKKNKYFFVATTVSLLILFFLNVSCSSKKSVTRFVFLGDTRGDYKAKNPVVLNDAVLKKFVRQILSLNPKPKFIIFNGDMVAKTAYKKFPQAITKWKNTFLSPLKKAGITVYLTPGNHIVDQKKKYKLISASNYIERFRKNFSSDNPSNGPVGYKGVSYSFDYDDCHFVTATSFISHRGKDNVELTPKEFVQKKKDFEYFINKKNLNWLDKDLKNSNAKFKIFFTHCPIFSTGAHYEDLKSLNAHKKNQKDILKILDKHKIKLYLASHEHLYARVNVDSNNPKNSVVKNGFVELVVGSASAPISKATPRKNMKFKKFLHKYEMLIGDISKESIVFFAKDEEGNVIDEFIIK